MSQTIPTQDGCYAYAVTVAVALSQMVIMGVSASFTMFIQALSNDEALGRPSQTELSFARTAQMLLMFPVGVFAGYVSDRYGTRLAVLIAGVSLLLMSLVVPSAHSVTAFIALYSATIGVSVSFMSGPGPATIGSWFSQEKAALGIGIGEAGVATGTALMPLAAGFLLDHFGEDDWRSALRWMGVFATIPILASSITATRPHADAADEENGKDPATPTVPPPSLWTLLQSRDFAILFATQTLFGITYFGFLFISAPFARIMGHAGTEYAHAHRISVKRSAFLLTCCGAASAVGALLIGAMSIRTGSRIALVACNVAAAALLLAGIHIRQFNSMIAWYSALGFCFAGGLTCIPALVVQRFAGPNLNGIMSASFVGFGIGGMVGPPVFSILQQWTGKRRSFDGSLEAGAVSLGLIALLHVCVNLRPQRAAAANTPQQTNDGSQLLQGSSGQRYGTTDI